MKLKKVIVSLMLVSFFSVIFISGKILQNDQEVIDIEAQRIDLMLRNLEPGIDYVPGQIIVQYRKSEIDMNEPTRHSRIASLNGKYNTSQIDELPSSNIQLLETRRELDEVMKELVKDPAVETTQLNYIYRISSISTNDPLRGDLWGLHNTGQSVNEQSGGKVDADIDAPEAWAINEGTTSQVVVAVIDTGVDYFHPDLAGNMWDGANCKDHQGRALGGCVHGYDFQDYDKTPLPASEAHGTHIAGIISAQKNNEKGVIGIAPNSKIMSVRTSLFTMDTLKAIDFAKHNGAKVINASWGGSVDDRVMKQAIENFPGLFVAAAGNSTLDHSDLFAGTYPCDFDLANIICVAATDQDDELAEFSDFGSTDVDIAAPGNDILSTFTEFDEVEYDFEAVDVGGIPSGWTKSGSNNKWGVVNDPVWTKRLYAHSQGEPYDNNANTSITTQTINMNTKTAALGFSVYCDTQIGTSSNQWPDYLEILYSRDGTNYVNAKDPMDSTRPFRISENYLGYPVADGGITTLLFMDYPITIPEDVLTSGFKLRFNWITDGSDNSYDGCALDEIVFYKYTEGEEYEYSPGTSMAAPYVSGVAALMWGYKPGLAVSQVKSLIMETGDSLPSLSGKTVSGKRLNAHKAMLGAQEVITTTIPPTTIPPIASSTVTTTPAPEFLCGFADIDGNGIFDIADFGSYQTGFATYYQRECDDTEEMRAAYMPCGGKDVVISYDGDYDGEFGLVDIYDFQSFAKRYSSESNPRRCDLTLYPDL